MWKVTESKAATKALDRAPASVKANFDAWLQIVKHSGPDGLRLIKGFHDEALSGRWQDHRSSRLSRDYRLIYRVQRDAVEVHVVDMTKHDYRKR